MTKICGLAGGSERRTCNRNCKRNGKTQLERQKLAELRRTGQPVRYEKEYLRKDGTRVPVELLVNLGRDAAGQSDLYYAFVTDITERKQAEHAEVTAKQAVRRSEARWNAAIENFAEGAIIATED